jgi:Family of unknown function (DUF6499)
VFDRPNWKEGSAYPNSQSPVAQFAWEFLRRNEKYHGAWRDFICQLKAGATDVLTQQAISELENGAMSPSNAALSRLQELQEALAIVEDHGNGETTTRDLDVALGLRWGLKRIVSPGRQYDHRTIEFFQAPGVWEVRVQAKPAPDRFLVLKIDLQAPAKVTEKMVLDHIKMKRNHRVRAKLISLNYNRSRPKSWQVYLRLLDARHLNVPWKEIAVELQPRIDGEVASQALQNMGKPARELCENGYKDIVALGV